ncbi:MAG: LacI family transcriptional regulator [Carboxylicivirga sp.]|jgi:LacI family transcriptional regulator|nr:LacI family transcriptional regulator [Carboxylicivirga sp.]MCT4643487.1 LacI family transcriptional regulator [Carboxylicivirga sp.]
MKSKRVKLVDIAAKLNVSVGLVSLVLSGKAKENRISEAMAKKVIETANEMGYSVNQLARGLRTGKSGIIGLLVADIANPYFGKMARFIENEASKLGYQVMFGSSDENPDKLRQLIDVFVSRQVDGIIVVPVKGSDELLSKEAFQVPIIFIDRYCDNIQQDYVCSDNFEGAFQLCNVLIKKGFRKIAAMVYNTDLSNNRDRIKGYKAALAEAGLDVDENLIHEVAFQHLETRLEPALKSAINAGCDAFFFANNSLGIESIKLFNQSGIKIGEDLGMVSFDNPEVYHVVKPGITCYEQPIEAMSQFAVKLLCDKIKSKEKYINVNKMLTGNLILRDSS